MYTYTQTHTNTHTHTQTHTHPYRLLSGYWMMVDVVCIDVR